MLRPHHHLLYVFFFFFFFCIFLSVMLLTRSFTISAPGASSDAAAAGYTVTTSQSRCHTGDPGYYNPATEHKVQTEVSPARSHPATTCPSSNHGASDRPQSAPEHPESAFNQSTISHPELTIPL